NTGENRQLERRGRHFPDLRVTSGSRRISSQFHCKERGDMGQRPNLSPKTRGRKASASSVNGLRKSLRNADSATDEPLTLAIFQTKLGWIGAVGRGEELVCMT